MTTRVAIFGAGVAGLSAAHELACRGYQVEVYESGHAVGGKARSQWVPREGGSGGVLPGEHGFRFFPYFYRNVVDTMSRIPLDPSNATVENCMQPDQVATVKDNLIGVDLGAVALDGKLFSFPRRRANVSELFDAILVHILHLGVGPADAAIMVPRMIRFFLSCDDRREFEFERFTWWEFIGGDLMSESAQHYIQILLKSLVAMDAKQGSAHTIGKVSLHLYNDMTRDGSENDRILKGPTSLMWLDPWQQTLEALGVTFSFGQGVAGFEFDETTGRITGATLENSTTPVEADHYICALPIEVTHPLITPALQSASEQLSKLKSIPVGDKVLGWMVGAQIYLKKDVSLVEGHAFYPNSEWALTTISQAQFWSDEGRVDFKSTYGDGVVEGIISVDISDWDTPGSLYGLPAKQCTAKQVEDELVFQLARALNGPGEVRFDEQDILYIHLDDDLESQGPDDGSLTRWVNRSRLVIHPPGFWPLRPTASTEIPNFHLAGDWVKTKTDLATMEGACESGRAAANGILAQDGRGDLAEEFDLRDLEPAAVKAAKEIDQILWDLGIRDLGADRPGIESGLSTAVMAMAPIIDRADDLLDRLDDAERVVHDGLRGLFRGGK